MKILLVAINAKYIHSNLGVYSLSAYSNDTGADIKIGEYTINNNRDDILSAIYEEKSDVVAFSAYIWNIEYIRSIAKELKKLSPQTALWIGGPEVSYDADAFLLENYFFDLVMLGEGEETFKELVEKCLVNESNMLPDEILKEVDGIAYKDSFNSNIISNPVRPLMNMDDLPFVYDNIDDFENRIIYYETSRGCPFSCSYCLSSIDKSVRFRSLNIVYGELKYFLDKKVKQVKFVDRTFNCNREHSQGIWKYIAENDNGITNFHFEISSDLLTETDFEIFKVMRPGLIQLEIGLQSTNVDTIKEIKRVMNIDKLSDALYKVHHMKNIHQHLDLIAGLPFEDYTSFTNSFNDAYRLNPDQLQLGFLKVLKGSYIYENREQYGLVYHDYPPYEVMATDWLSYDEVLCLKQVEEVLEVYHNSAQFTYSIEYLLSFFDTPYELYYSLGMYYEANNLFGTQHKRVARYDILREFVADTIKDIDKAMFDELLLYDLYLRENMKSRPLWAPSMDEYKHVFVEFFKNGGNEEMSLTVGVYEYNSKSAARLMHIEPLSIKAANVITKRDNNHQMFAVFDYENRNPLSNDATVVIINSLA